MPEPQDFVKRRTRLRPKRVLAAGAMALLATGAAGFAVGFTSIDDDAELARLRDRLAALESAAASSEHQVAIDRAAPMDIVLATPARTVSERVQKSAESLDTLEQARTLLVSRNAALRSKTEQLRLLIEQQESTATTEERGLLGVYGQDAADGGAELSSIVADTPAARAGLEAGDRVVMINDEPIADYQDLHAAICARQPGETITILIRRGDALTLKEIELGSLLSYKQKQWR